MKFIILSILLVFCGFSALFSEEELVLGATFDVDLIAVSKVDESGHKYGVDLYAHNRGSKDKEIKITLTETENVKDQLREGWTFAPAGKRTRLGSIRQEDQTKAYNWWVDWLVRELP